MPRKARSTARAVGVVSGASLPARDLGVEGLGERAHERGGEALRPDVVGRELVCELVEQGVDGREPARLGGRTVDRDERGRVEQRAARGDRLGGRGAAVRGRALERLLDARGRGPAAHRSPSRSPNASRPARS